MQEFLIFYVKVLGVGVTVIFCTMWIFFMVMPYFDKMIEKWHLTEFQLRDKENKEDNKPESISESIDE